MTTNGGSADEPTSWGPASPGSRAAEQHTAAEPTVVESVPVPHPGAGRLIGGRYRLLERLGSGGMGTVWRAHDETVDRDVAVKEPRLPEQLTDAERRTMYLRMQREARAAARVDHPSVVTVHDVVTVEDRPWIVMELVRGRSLAEVLEEGTLPAREAARIGLAVLEALVSAHEAGVLHRDVKPANILLGRHDRVVLSDFGIAQVEGEQKLTETGSFIGSPEYLAPERVLGQRPGPESDLWSLGVVLYQAVEGVSPFRRQTTASTLQAVLLAEVPRPANAGPLGAVLGELLRKEPQARPAPSVLRRLLRAVAEPAAVPVTRVMPAPATWAQRMRRALAGRRSIQLTLGAAALAATVAAVLVFSGDDPLPDGWKRYQESRLDATLAAPAGYVRSEDDQSVSFTDPTQVFVVKFSRWTGESRGPLAVANADLAWYKDHYFQGPKPDGNVTTVQQQGKDAALLDVTYEDHSDYKNPKDQRALELDVIRKDGAGFKLEVSFPSAADQAAQGRKMFDQARENLTINGL